MFKIPVHRIPCKRVFLSGTKNAYNGTRRTNRHHYTSSNTNKPLQRKMSIYIRRITYVCLGYTDCVHFLAYVCKNIYFPWQTTKIGRSCAHIVFAIQETACILFYNTFFEKFRVEALTAKTRQPY